MAVCQKHFASEPAVTGATQRDNQVVLVLPAALRTNGFAVETGSGDRLPEAGFATPLYASAAHFNATDVVILLVLAAGVWYGFKRGLAVELADLIVVMAGLTVAVMVVRPLTGRLAQLTDSPLTGALLASGLLMVVLGIAGLLMVPKLLSIIQSGAETINARLSGVCGSTAAAVRQCVVLAMLLTMGADLYVLRWASPSIHSSVLGETLVQAWRSLFMKASP